MEVPDHLANQKCIGDQSDVTKGDKALGPEFQGLNKGFGERSNTVAVSEKKHLGGILNEGHHLFVRPANYGGSSSFKNVVIEEQKKEQGSIKAAVINKG